MNQQAGRFGSLAALIGGPMWITYYGIDLITGATGNCIIEQSPFSSPLTIASMLLFNLAIVTFNGANLGLFRKLNGRSRGWGRAGLIFAGIAVWQWSQRHSSPARPASSGAESSAASASWRPASRLR